MALGDPEETQPTSAQRNNRTHLRLHSIDVYVRNQERSLHFYLDQLGFQLAFDASLQSGQRWVGVSPPDGTALLTLIEAKPNTPEHKLIGRASRAIFVTDDVFAKFAEWTSKGVRFRHAPRLRRIAYRSGGEAAKKTGPIWGEIFTRFEDIDRNSFALVSFDEVNKAIEEQRRAVLERQEAERRMAHELEIARQVQARLFPQALPRCESLQVAGICSQARHVGGDYYDLLSLDSDRFVFLVGDIAGKGIAAALLMSNLQAHLRSQFAAEVDDPQKLLTSVNRLFYENSAASAYATLFFVQYQDKLRRLRYVNCGHVPALLIHEDGRAERLDSTATVIGLFPRWECETAESRLTAGDVLVIYSDGVTEACDEDEQEFGEAGLIESIQRNQKLAAVEMAQAIVEDVRRHGGEEQQDDITLVIAKCN